uniref:Uncharacterized protein n=1 Tax=Siphoviridae sp. ctRlj31 TaxID=2826338 RepID=A0A8S5N6B2_9CAUD|nr:MAG TPA: hypothetical protein [Siphoviridae sp. ctRlj31]
MSVVLGAIPSFLKEIHPQRPLLNRSRGNAKPSSQARACKTRTPSQQTTHP